MADMDLYKALGAVAARRRKQLKLTQAQVASGIGLTRASLANIETGRQKLLLHQVYRLASALQLDSILDLVPATFETDPTEQLPFKSGQITSLERQQVENVVRLAMAIERPKRRGRS